MASFGMMNEAYFVGKRELIDWINNFLEIHIEKVEQMATGALYCNLFDAIHPGTIPMSRVDFTVVYEYDFMKNWKLVQTAFQKAGIDKVIPVQRLIKAKYQDNLEFFQWMYKYARDTYNGDIDDPTYDAIGRRLKSKGGKEFTGSSKPGLRANRSKANRPTSAASRGSARTFTGKPSMAGNRRNGNRGASSRANDEELQELRDEVQRLNESRDELQGKYDVMSQQHEEIEKIAKDIECERDFYFNKVVAIENRLKDEQDQDTSLLKSIYEILYQTEDDQKPSASAPTQGIDQVQLEDGGM